MKSANELGYKVNNSGICLGVSTAGANAFWVSLLTKEDGLQAYLRGMLRLQLDTAAILQKNKLNAYHFRLFGFFDRVKLIQESQDHQPYHCTLLSNSEGSATSTKRLLQLRSLTRSDAMVTAEGEPILQVDISLFLGAYTLDELNDYLECLRDHLGDLPFELQLSSGDHTLFLCFCPTTKTWLMFNANSSPLKTFDAFKHTSLVPRLNGSLSDHSTHTIISTVIRTADIFADELKVKMELLNADDRWKKLHEITPEKVAIQDNNSYDLLYLAAVDGDLKSLQALIKAGADANKTVINNNFTLLYVAAKNGHLECVKALIGAGANVNQTVTHNRTPLYIAAENGQLACVEALIAAGADVNIASTENATPFDIATHNGHLQCAQALTARASASTRLSQ